jgi:hypothetical protein
MAKVAGLERTAQEDFAAGAIRSAARTLISSRGTYDVLNGLHDDDGSVYRRGGNSLRSDTGAAPVWVWDGVVGPSLPRTVLASTADFEVLDADDETRVNLGGAGLAAPVKPAVLDGILFIPGGTLYAGSRKAADYSTGTVAGTAGQETLTGTGTTWSTNLDAGMLIRVAGAGRYYVIRSVDSNTQVTLMQPLLTSPAGATYVASRLGTAADHGVRTEAAALPVVAAHENRLVVGVGDTIYFSNGVDADTGALRTQTFGDTDFHRVTAGVGVVALESLRDRLLLFTTGGIYALTNMAFDLIDFSGNVQQRMERLTEDVVAWSAAGICSFGNALVVPGVDDIYLVDGISQPVPVSGSITPLVRETVQAGKKSGGAAVYNGHLLLPIIAAGDAPEETWLLRLDRPVQTGRGIVFPFSRFDSAGAVSCYARRSRASLPTKLLAADTEETAITDCSSFFAPSATARTDVGGAFRFRLDLRDFVTGSGQENQVRRFRVRYELVDAASDAYLTGWVGTGAPFDDTSPRWGVVTWGSFTWGPSGVEDFTQMAGLAPEDDGRTPFTWAPEKRCRIVRFRLETSDPCDKLTIRSIEFWTRRSGKI